VFANNPLAMHANAPFMATAAICAGEQGHYWDMHDRLFEEPGAPKTRPVVLVLVGEMGMDTTVFEACLDESSTAKERIDRDIEKARELGLTGTPGFALGRIGSEGVVRIETLIRGAQPFATFESAIDALR
jgi:protein-disulfide isomerase